MKKSEQVPFYLINQATLEEICQEHNPGFPFFAAPCEPWLFAGSTYPWHWHSYAHFFYVEKGEIRYQTPLGTYYFQAGEGGFINANVLHMMSAKSSEKSRYIELLFHPSVVGGAAQSDIMQKYIQTVTENTGFDIFPITRNTPGHEEMIGILRDVYALFCGREVCYELLIRSKLSLLWAMLFQQSRERLSQPQPRQTSSRLKTMLLYIKEHAAEKISLDQIAKAGACSRRECNRSFQSELHTTPFQYLLEVRLNNACEMLINSNASITVISETCGFSDPSHFTKTFKAQSGLSPKQFRDQNRQNI